MSDYTQNSVESFVAFLDSTADNKTGVDGLTSGDFTVELAKAGAAFSTVAPAIAEIGNGWYRLTPIAAHRDTLGASVWRITAPGANPAEFSERVVAPENDPPSVDDIATEVLSRIANDHGSGSYETADVAGNVPSVDDIATEVLSRIANDHGAGSYETADPPTAAQIAAQVLTDFGGDAAGIVNGILDGIEENHGSGSYQTGSGSSGPTAAEIAEAVLRRDVTLDENNAGKHSLAAVVMLSTNSVRAGDAIVARKPSNDATFQTYTITSADVDPMTGIS